jgi:hypothetical protein
MVRSLNNFPGAGHDQDGLARPARARIPLRRLLPGLGRSPGRFRKRSLSFNRSFESSAGPRPVIASTDRHRRKPEFLASFLLLRRIRKNGAWLMCRFHLDA